MKAARDFYEHDAGRRIHADGTDPVVAARNRLVLQLLPPGDRCLDIGCGAGGFAPLLHEKFRFVSGVDLSLVLAKSAAQRGMRSVCTDVDETDLPFARGAFDAAVCCDVMEHVFDPVVFARRIAAALKPNGTLAVSVPNIRYLPRILSLLRGYFPRTTGDPNGYDGGHLHYFATKNVIEVLEAAAFTGIQAYGYNADPSRRSSVVSLGLKLPVLRDWSREFGCSTIIVVGRATKGAAGA